MIINKTTSDALLVASLVVNDNNGKPLKNVTEYDTDTRVATLSAGGPATGTSFSFAVGSEDDFVSLTAMLSADLKTLVAYTKSHGAKKAMDDVVSPDDYLVFRGILTQQMVECTNCSTRFLIHVDDEGDLWSTNKPQAPDVFETLTSVDDASLTCDNCSNDVALYDENPW